MLIARPIARDIGHARRKRARQRQAGHQQQQRLHDNGAHALGVALRHLCKGLGRDLAGLQLHLRVCHVGQPRVPQKQPPADDEDGRKPRHRVHQIEADEAGQAHAQHFPKQLPPRLGKILFGIIALPAFAVVIAVHHFSKHVGSSVKHKDTACIIAHAVERVKTGASLRGAHPQSLQLLHKAKGPPHPHQLARGGGPSTQG